MKRAILAAVAAVAIVALSSSADADTFGEPFDLDAGQIEAVESAVRDKLNDPDSAQFKRVSSTYGKANYRIVCGLVNAKNGFGGYGGFVPFLVLIKENDSRVVRIGDADAYGNCKKAGIDLRS